MFCALLFGLGAPLVLPASADRLVRTPSVGPLSVGVRYRAPLLGRLVVLRPFEAPPSPYAAGHRGVDLATSRGTVVVAAAPGRVSFAGQVAGRGVVVVAHADGIRTEYEPVHPLVSAGQVVTAGQPIGQLHGKHDQCSPDRCLHWGARRGDLYLDPMLLLRPLGPVRLLPWPAIGTVVAAERSRWREGPGLPERTETAGAWSTVRHDGQLLMYVGKVRGGSAGSETECGARRAARSARAVSSEVQTQQRRASNGPG